MSQYFQFEKVTPPETAAGLQIGDETGKTIIALDIQTKIQFRSSEGSVEHEYLFPSNRHIQNCGGYVDKLIKYRSTEVRNAVEELASKGASHLPLPDVLKGRSILVDQILAQMVDRLLGSRKQDRATIFDHGCTVAEHYELLDQMMYARSGYRASERLSYVGLDVSPLALSAARILHPNAPESHFQLILAEGSDISLGSESVDFSLSIGVVNHVRDPLHALDRLLDISRNATVLVLWATGENSGFWATNHSGVPNYFFSIKDLGAMSEKYAHKGRFYYAAFTPESQSTQISSYIGLSPQRLALMGSYTLAFCRDQFVLPEFVPLNFTDTP